MERERGSCRANPSVKARIIMEVIMTQPLWPRPWGLRTFSPLSPLIDQLGQGTEKELALPQSQQLSALFGETFTAKKHWGQWMRCSPDGTGAKVRNEGPKCQLNAHPGQMEQGIAAQCECPLSRAVIDGSAHLPQHTSAIPTLTRLPLRAKRRALQCWSGALQSQLNHQHVITESL
ncbi:hypothetical protein MHYP_G00078500 [Metynnis hypsauchen]